MIKEILIYYVGTAVINYGDSIAEASFYKISTHR